MTTREQQRIITSKQWFDGSGRVVRAGTGTGDAPDSYDMTATVYDGWGRVAKQSNPYLGDASGNPQAGVTQFWTVNTYDELSRVVKVTLPDNQTIQTDLQRRDGDERRHCHRDGHGGAQAQERGGRIGQAGEGDRAESGQRQSGVGDELQL